jgi:hypothetical protein
MATNNQINKRDIPESEEPKANPYPYPTKPSTTTTTTSNTTATATKSSKPTTTSTKIPRPILKSNGNPTTQLLYPFATVQPLRLYNRGLEDEHYGFYTYFSKSVLVANGSSTSNLNSNSSSSSSSSNLTLTVVSANQQAQALCTFTQTRFRVQIWTRRGLVSGLNETSMDDGSGAAGEKKAAWESSANEMEATGSFPYKTSFLLDRESGDGDGERGVFCWGLEDGKVVGEGVRIAETDIAGLVEDKRGNDKDGKCACGWES